MAYGVENQIGIGQAQVLPRAGNNLNAFVQQLNDQKRYKDQQDRYNQQVKQRDQRDLYELVGDTLNLRDFNPVIHDRVKKAQIGLAQKIKSENPSYADTYLAAQNVAAELGGLSQSLNQLDQQIAATKKEYEGDKRINSANLEKIARKKILDQLNTTGQVDPSINYFDEALNDHPEFALTDNADYTVTKFIPEEKQSLFGKFNERNAVGRTQKFEWKADNYPVYYDFKDNGEDKPPTISTRSQSSGFKDDRGADIPMLSEESYGRLKAQPSNVAALNLRLRKQYGPNLDLRSEEAEILRRIEAYKDVDRNKPRVNKSVIEQAPLPPRISIRVGDKSGDLTVRDIWTEVNEKTSKGQELPFNLGTAIKLNELSASAQKIILEYVNKITGSGATQGDVAIAKSKDGTINMVNPETGEVIAPIDFGDINVQAQPSVKEKRKVIEDVNKSKKKDPLGILD